MKKVLLATLALACVFTACGDKNKNKKNPVKIEVSGITAVGVTTVKALLYNEPTRATTAPVVVVIAEAPFENGKFTLTLPLTVDATYLKEVKKANLPANALNVESFKWAEIDITGHSATAELGDFRLGKTNVDASYMFIDKAITLVGKTEIKDGEQEVYNIKTTKAGWYVVYEITEEIAASGTGETIVEAHTKTTMQTETVAGTAWKFFDNRE